MTTNFALSLSFEGIQLLHRVTGGWRVVGDADVEAQDLDAVLADLRKKALALEPGGLRTKIVIPLDQIKYMALDTTRTTQDDINAALDGATPYNLDELVIDCERRGGRTHIAAVARETLDEAEAFARAHRFNPVACVAIPEPFTFQSEVFFGPTSMMSEVLGPTGTVERDILPIMVVGTRIKSRLLIFDIPEDELPPADGMDLAGLLAPHLDDPAPVAADATEAAEPAAKKVVIEPPEAAQVTDGPADADDPVVVEKTTAQPVVSEPEPVAEPEEPEPAIVDPVEDVVIPDVNADVVDASDPAKEVEGEIAPDPDVPQTDTEEPDLFAAALVSDVSKPAEAEVTPPPETPAPAPAPVDVAASAEPPESVVSPDPAPEQPALPDVTYPMHIDPVIAEYHTARPKYKRRARRRVVGSITAVAPASDAPVIAAPVVPAAPTPPTRQAVAQAAPVRSKKLLVGTAIAASVALAGLLAWWQLGPGTADTPTDFQVEPVATAETVDSAAIAIQTAPATQEVVVVQDAIPPSDVPPRVELLDVLRQTVPATHDADIDLIVAWAGYDPVGATPLLDVAQPDAPLGAIAPMPAPPAPVETAQAQVGAPVLRGRVLSPDEAARIYDATGVWQRAPRIIDIPQATVADGAGWPKNTLAPGKVAQPIVPQVDTLVPELTFVAPADPPPPDATFDLDENGNIVATATGAVTPEGAVVVAGLPDLNVRPRPTLTEDDLARMALLAPATEGVVIVAGAPDVIPPTRPAAAALPQEEVVTPGGVGLASLRPDGDVSALVETDQAALGFAAPTGPRPLSRPAGLVPAAPPADLPSNPDITSVIAGIAQEAATTPFIDATARAVGASRRPQGRPRNFATVVASARQRLANQQAAPAAAAPAPQQASAPVSIPRNTGPAPGGVARAATQEDAIGLRDINLIGVYGRPNNRRALVRLSNGSYVRVEIGSRLDGGQVTAIGDNALNYVKRGRTFALQVPG